MVDRQKDKTKAEGSKRGGFVPAGEDAVGMATLLGGGGLPAPPVYKGCTMKERREFMDRHLSYQRRILPVAVHGAEHCAHAGEYMHRKQDPGADLPVRAEKASRRGQ